MMASSLSASGISVAFWTVAMFTASPCVSIGVITMKMISRTSMTSAMGTTFGAAMTAPAWGLYAMGLLLSGATRDEVVDQLHRGVVHLDVESLNLVGEIVVRPDGGHGDEQAERGGDERFGNTAGDGGEAGSLRALDAFEG